MQNFLSWLNSAICFYKPFQSLFWFSFPDFSDDDDDFDNNYEYPSSVGSYNQCRVIYEYSANATDELDIKPGWYHSFAYYIRRLLHTDRSLLKKNDCASILVKFL